MGPEQVALPGVAGALYTAQTGFTTWRSFSPCGWGEDAREMVQKKIGSGITLKAAKPVLVGLMARTEPRRCPRTGTGCSTPPRTGAERQAALVQGIDILQGLAVWNCGMVVDVYGCQADEALKANRLFRERYGPDDPYGLGYVMLVRRDSA